MFKLIPAADARGTQARMVVPFSWSGDDIQITTHIGHACLHIRQAMTDGLAGLFQIETIPIVLDLQQGTVGRAPQVNRNLAGIGMFGNIRQGFLADVEQRHCIDLQQIRQSALSGRPD